ncbi:unnamed protein product [Rotaria magnacalcarata]|uniref:Uncharacterized protein n=1 Tax=Rotaria magnacalcarata TaxID=392030 RepID=A0A816R761_9BILA|nr:unnamed protein product [Rotaria magnacalcarata]CAF2069034.1 unnamed protein product [Rotaria magnacalcarata]CAF3767488.1 unnamed protein product [Rotaria magnacalcarata]CAF4001946.1 unnamed protein product [Rotaria magnacalcarata]
MSKDVEKKVEDIGSMCIILHRERSFHNVNIRILKSALQKYARRAMFAPKGVWCLIELDLFSYLEIKPDLCPNTRLTRKQIQQNSVRIRSNMINRLVAFMSEDVGPCNSQLPSKIYDFYLQWIKSRRELSSRKILIQMYHCLANENIKRIRLLSDLKTVYNLPECAKESDKLHRKLLEKFQMNELIKIMYENESQKKTKQQLYELIIEHLSMKSELAFAYLSVLFKRNDQSLINQHLWPYLLQTSPFTHSTRALAFFYKTLKHKEHYLYLYHAMAFVIYEDTIRKIDQQSNEILNIDIDQLYKDHLNAETNIELDSFVFDRHTGIATTRSEFALEGAQVANESKELFIDKYRQMYNEFKVMMDNDEQEKKQKKETKSRKTKRKTEELHEENIIKKKAKLNTDEQVTTDAELDNEIIRLDYHIDIKPTSFVSDELANLAHGQPRTSAHKKAVFISSDYIYKGPYLSNLQGDRKRLLYNLYFTRALLTLEQYLKIPEYMQSIIDWESVVKIDNTNEYYLKQKSVGKASLSENDHDRVTTKLETNVKILRRGSHINRLIELEKDESNFLDDKKQICQACLQHFYLRYILNIGDSGTWNILVRRDRNQGICGIDFEEIRSEKSKKTNDPLAILMSKISKRQQYLYGPFINDIIIFKNKIDSSNELAMTLSVSFKIDIETMNERIAKYNSCILKKK